MTSFPNSPKLMKGGIVLIDPVTGVMQRIISLQYNPGTLTRSFQVKGVGEEGERSEALRLTGPPVETYKLEAEIDAADQLEFPEQHENVVKNGIASQLAVLETIIYPKNSALLANNSLAQSGVLEIAPMESLLTVFVWSKNRVLPVRITEFSVTEEAFDPALNPIQAKVNLGMRVLTVDDLGFDHKGGNLFLGYHQLLEQLAAKSANATFTDLGISGV